MFWQDWWSLLLLKTIFIYYSGLHPRVTHLSTSSDAPYVSTTRPGNKCDRIGKFARRLQLTKFSRFKEVSCRNSAGSVMRLLHSFKLNSMRLPSCHTEAGSSNMVSHEDKSNEVNPVRCHIGESAFIRESQPLTSNFFNVCRSCRISGGIEVNPLHQ